MKTSTVIAGVFNIQSSTEAYFYALRKTETLDTTTTGGTQTLKEKKT